MPCLNWVEFLVPPPSAFLRIWPTYTLLFGTYTFINLHKIFYLQKLFIPCKGIFWFFVLVHQVVLVFSISLFLNQFDFQQFVAILSGPKYLYLAMKTSYVYLVPTCLLILRKNSHLHVYLVYTFIQYHGVYCYFRI